MSEISPKLISICDIFAHHYFTFCWVGAKVNPEAVWPGKYKIYCVLLRNFLAAHCLSSQSHTQEAAALSDNLLAAFARSKH
jgi:hypothetical protein